MAAQLPSRVPCPQDTLGWIHIEKGSQLKRPLTKSPWLSPWSYELNQGVSPACSFKSSHLPSILFESLSDFEFRFEIDSNWAFPTEAISAATRFTTRDLAPISLR
ncbi:hypothetical protein CC2G_003426 [Coprinopsis cinerea AmutBmut pab1-1]|nr:hypothetical protein CC2G_003426 [Coprinopsis cinerea AmutBmut pab1-1]